MARILLCPHRFLPARGGVQTVFAALARSLGAAGHAATVLTSTATTTGSLGWPSEGRLPAGRFVLDGVETLRLEIAYPHRLVRHAWGALRPIAPAAARRALAGPRLPGLEDAVRAAAPDLIVTAGLPFRHCFDLGDAARRLGVPFALMPCVHADGANPADTSETRRLAVRAEHVLALTEFEAELLRSWGVAGDRIRVLPLGSDLPAAADSLDVRASRDRCGLTGERPYFLAFGRLHPQKELDVVVRAFAQIASAAKDIDLVLAGAATPWSRDELPRVVAEALGPEAHRVRVVPDVPEDAKRGLFAGCRALVSASREESFGLVFLAAWECGRPSVGTRIGAIRSVFGHADAGLLFEPGSVGGLAEAMGRLAADPGAADTMGARGRDRQRDFGGWAAGAALLADLAAR